MDVLAESSGAAVGECDCDGCNDGTRVARLAGRIGLSGWSLSAKSCVSEMFGPTPTLSLLLLSTTMTSTSASESDLNDLFCSLTPETARQVLDEIADDLGKDIHVRQRMGQASPSVWPGLNNLWKSVDAENPASRDLIASLAKFTRNLVAAVPENQIKALYVPRPAELQILK